MTRILGLLLRRLPIGWLQLVHNKSRLAAAISGIAFANLLVFFQLGFLGALGTSVMLPYGVMQADLILSAPASRQLSDDDTIPAQRVYDALEVPGVADATGVFVGTVPMQLPGEREMVLTVFGIDPFNVGTFWDTDVAEGAAALELADTALLDAGTRMFNPAILAAIEAGQRPTFEANSRTIALADTFRIGAGFESDGYLIVSDQTFLRLFPNRAAGAPNHVFVRTAPGADVLAVADTLAASVPSDRLKIQTRTGAADAERRFQTVERPVGVIFGFGAVMGVIVGLVIVYQVLSTDVADHLREYATFKAIGYRFRFFLGIITEEALILAVAGFIPGSIVSTLIYGLLAGTTGLQLEMTQERLIMVFFGTVAMCILSGALAARRLSSADPADLF